MAATSTAKFNETPDERPGVALAFNRLGPNTVFTTFCRAQVIRVQCGKLACSPSFAFAFAPLEIGFEMENFDEEGDHMEKVII